MDKTDKDILKGHQQASAERNAEWERIKEKYPIKPTDPPEVQESMRVAREVAMLDP